MASFENSLHFYLIVREIREGFDLKASGNFSRSALRTADKAVGAVACFSVPMLCMMPPFHVSHQACRAMRHFRRL